MKFPPPYTTVSAAYNLTRSFGTGIRSGLEGLARELHLHK